MLWLKRCLFISRISTNSIAMNSITYKASHQQVICTEVVKHNGLQSVNTLFLANVNYETRAKIPKHDLHLKISMLILVLRFHTFKKHLICCG